MSAPAVKKMNIGGAKPLATQAENGATGAPFAQPANYLPLNPMYPGIRSLHADPPVFLVDNFLAPEECDALIEAARGHMTPAPVVGPGNGEVSLSRTSSTCYLAREDLPTICTKVCALAGKPVEHLELPQVGRYRQTEFYKPHYDAFDTGSSDGKRFAQNGGQRVATVLVYLNDVANGGETSFSKLGLRVRPVKGTALVFFPATLDGILDQAYLHAAEPAHDPKWVSQIWIRQRAYNGLASVRISPI
mmetsp:Transcript_12577/g.37410  ORF Transcript_12577/g.37410 Transcript_12577/m.37410 type:complete len:247 (+) Transcript_12577:209-949(+)